MGLWESGHHGRGDMREQSCSLCEPGMTTIVTRLLAFPFLGACHPESPASSHWWVTAKHRRVPLTKCSVFLSIKSPVFVRIPGVTYCRTNSVLILEVWHEHPLSPLLPPYTSTLIFPIRAFSHGLLPLLQKSPTQSRGICLNTLNPTQWSRTSVYQNHPYQSQIPVFGADWCKASCGLKFLCPAVRPSASHLIHLQPY